MPDLSHLIDEYLADLTLDGLSITTLKSRRTILRHYSRQVGNRLGSADRAQVAAFLSRDTLSTNSRHQYLAAIRGFYDWGIKRGYLDLNPAVDIRGPKFKAGLPRPMPPRQFAYALHTAAPNVRTWLLLGAYAGLRCCEMAALRGSDLDLEAKQPVMSIIGKGGKHALVPIGPQLIEDLRTRAWHDGWLFPHRHRPSEHVLATSVSAMVNRHLRSIGITSTAHSTRHLFGTSVYQASGYDLRLTQELLRHSSPQTTAIYTKLDPSRAAAVIGLLGTPAQLAG